jgi:hypothetical protein
MEWFSGIGVGVPLLRGIFWQFFDWFNAYNDRERPPGRLITLTNLTQP